MQQMMEPIPNTLSTEGQAFAYIFYDRFSVEASYVLAFYWYWDLADDEAKRMCRV